MQSWVAGLAQGAIHRLLERNTYFVSEILNIFLCMQICNPRAETLCTTEAATEAANLEMPASSSPPRGQRGGSRRSQRHRLLRRSRTAWGCARSKWNFLGKTPVCIALPPSAQQASSAAAKAGSSPVPSSSFLEMTFSELVLKYDLKGTDFKRGGMSKDD